MWICSLALGLSTVASALVIDNPHFDVNVDGWHDDPAGGTTSVSWNALDADGDPNSGSLQLDTATYFDGPQSNCVAIHPLTEYQVFGKIRIPTQVNTPIAAVTAVFYANEDCTDGRQTIRYSLFQQPIPLDTWVEVGGIATSWSMVHSANVWLMTEATSPAGARVVLFDDVRLELAPEPGASIAVLAACATLGLLARSRA